LMVPAPSTHHTLPLHDALPIFAAVVAFRHVDEILATPAVVHERTLACARPMQIGIRRRCAPLANTLAQRWAILGGTRGSRIRRRSEEHTSELQSRENLVCRLLL